MCCTVDICIVVHFGFNNSVKPKHLLELVEEERDLGVLIRSSLKVGNHCLKAVKLANSVLGMIARSFTNKNLPFYHCVICSLKIRMLH